MKPSGSGSNTIARPPQGEKGESFNDALINILDRDGVAKQRRERVEIPLLMVG